MERTVCTLYPLDGIGSSVTQYALFYCITHTSTGPGNATSISAEIESNGTAAGRCADTPHLLPCNFFPRRAAAASPHGMGQRFDQRFCAFQREKLTSSARQLPVLCVETSAFLSQDAVNVNDLSKLQPMHATVHLRFPVTIVASKHNPPSMQVLCKATA